jgi:hypothetical protein
MKVIMLVVCCGVVWCGVVPVCCNCDNLTCVGVVSVIIFMCCFRCSNRDSAVAVVVVVIFNMLLFY